MDQAGVSRIRTFVKKYSSPLLILAAGIILMSLPSGNAAEDSAADTSSEVAAKPNMLQEQLTDILSQVDGAGKVTVLLTEVSGEETIYQSDADSSGNTTVILTDNMRNQYGMVCRINSPIYQGAVVVCQGADRPAVRLALTQAVSNATGLSYDKITVLKMK